MTRTANEASSGIHTLKEEGRKGEGKITQKEDFLSNREKRPSPNYYSIVFRD